MLSQSRPHRCQRRPIGRRRCSSVALRLRPSHLSSLVALLYFCCHVHQTCSQDSDDNNQGSSYCSMNSTCFLEFEMALPWADPLAPIQTGQIVTANDCTEAMELLLQNATVDCTSPPLSESTCRCCPFCQQAKIDRLAEAFGECFVDEEDTDAGAYVRVLSVGFAFGIDIRVGVCIWLLAFGFWLLAFGMWHVACGMWHVSWHWAFGMWHLAFGVYIGIDICIDTSVANYPTLCAFLCFGKQRRTWQPTRPLPPQHKAKMSAHGLTGRCATTA